MALLPIFCVACSSRTDLSMLVARALKIGKIADGGMPPTYETTHLCIAKLVVSGEEPHQRHVSRATVVAGRFLAPKQIRSHHSLPCRIGRRR
jgi:hypothetical protein